jgi:Ca2+-binding EF-hand superfamily protein
MKDDEGELDDEKLDEIKEIFDSLDKKGDGTIPAKKLPELTK